MIINMRRQAKKRIFRVIVFICLFSMTIGSLLIPGLLRKITQTGQSLITVNGRGISPAQVATRMQHEYERIELLRQQFGKQADMILRMLGMGDPQQVAYEALVNEELLNGVASKIGLPLSESFIRQQFQNPSFVIQQLTEIVPFHVIDRTGTVNIQALKRYLRQMNLSMVEFERLVEESLQRATVLGLLSATAYVGNDDRKQYFIQKYAAKDYDMVTFSHEAYLKKARQQPVAADVLQAYFAQENKKNHRYWVPEKRSGIAWEFSVQNFNITISDADIKTYYDKHKNTQFVKTNPQIKLRRILLKVEDSAKEQEIYQLAHKLKHELAGDPSLFTQYAQQYSQDTATASQGGLMPWKTREELDEAIGNATTKMEKDGDISDVIRTKEGYEILQRAERKAKEFKPLDSVRSEIEKTIEKQRFPHLFEKTIKEVIKNQADSKKAVQDIAKKYKAKEKQVTNVTKDDQSRQAQELFKLKEHAIATYVDQDKDQSLGVVVLLESIEKSYEPAFDAVQNQVKDDYYESQATKALSSDMNRAKELMGTAKLADIAAQFQLSVEHQTGIVADSQEKAEELSKKGLPVQAMMDMYYVGDVRMVNNGADGFIVQLTSIGTVSDKELEQKRLEIEQDLLQKTQDRVQRGFVASLRRNATINISDELNNPIASPLEI